MITRYMVTRLWIKHKGKIYHAGEMLPEDFTSRDRFRNIHPSRVSAIQVDPAEDIPEPPELSELSELSETPEAAPPITTDDEPVVNTEEEVEVKDETQNEAQEQIESEDESKEEEEAVTDQEAPEETSEEEKRADAPISKSVGLSSSIKGTKPAAKNTKKHPGAPAGKK